MKLANYGQTVKKMEEAAYGLGDPLFHSLIFLLEPNQVFLTVAILLFFFFFWLVAEGIKRAWQSLIRKLLWWTRA